MKFEGGNLAESSPFLQQPEKKEQGGELMQDSYEEMAGEKGEFFARLDSQDDLLVDARRGIIVRNGSGKSTTAIDNRLLIVYNTYIG